jgi:Sulfotransferase family
MPDFFIVGHHKSGTTALYEMLRRHPQIYMPSLKEPRFFAGDLRFQFEPVESNVRPRTLDDYLSLFDAARPDQRTGEASPSYLRSQTAARAIHDVQPGARIIAILREPASFVRSLHLQLVQEHVETEKDLGRAVRGEAIVRGGRQVLRYSDHVRYVEQLRRYHSVFPREQVLVLIYDDFRRDNEVTVRSVLRFLGVDDTAPVQTLEANPTVRVRSLRLDGVLRSLRAGQGPLTRAAKATGKRLVPDDVRAGALRRLVYGEPRPPDETVLIELRRRFRDEVVALSEYLGRDLVTLWGYDDLG